MHVLIRGGVLGPWFVVSSAMTDEDVDKTVDVVAQACAVYRTVLDGDDPGPWLGRRSIKRCSVATCDVTVSLAPGI